MIIGIVLLCLAVVFLLFYASWSIDSGVYLKCLNRVETKEKRVYLTFDDGPDPEQTPKVLDVLKAHRAKAVFFCIGEKVEAHPEIVRRILAEGHAVGNHSHTHTSRFPLLRRQAMLADVEACSAALEKVSDRKVTLFRPPFGVTNPTVAAVVRRLGLRPVGWTIRTYDTRNSDPDTVLKHIEGKLKPGAIILLHDRLPGSDRLLHEILTYLKTTGYTFNSLLP